MSKTRPVAKLAPLIAIVAAGGLAVYVARAQSAGLVIRDVTVISPERATPLEHAFVRIRDGRIAEVSAQAISGDADIDGSGRFLVPGLIDSHVHWGTPAPAGMQFEQAAAFPDLANAALAQEPRSYLYFGFTTVINLNGLPEVLARWNQAAVHPDGYFCGAAPVANGFPMNVIPAGVRFRAARYFLYDPRQADRIPADVDAAAHTPAAVVALMASDGAICVKAHYEPGGPASGPLPTPTLEMLQALVAAARAKNLPVVIHANSKEAQGLAVAARPDIITHTMADGLMPDGNALSADAVAVLDRMVSAGIAYQPTLQALHGALALFDDGYLRDARLAAAVPPALLSWFSTADGGRYREAMLAGAGGEAAFRAGAALRLRSYDLVIRRLVSSNARLLFGTDTPATASYGNLSGLNGRLEMDRWIAAGVRPPQLFRALTIENARAFHVDRDLGSIEAGKRAHLLLLRENPLVRVEAYDTIETVVLAGRPLERGMLSARGPSQ